MNKIVRWNPRRHSMSLFNELDRFFERPFSGFEMPTNWGVAVDVAENDDNYIVKASVPGIQADDLEITLEDGVLTIMGEVKEDETTEEDNYHVRERRFGRFSRTVRFPVTVEGDAIVANYENGVLTLTVPKAEEVKPKRITVNVN